MQIMGILSRHHRYCSSPLYDSRRTNHRMPSQRDWREWLLRRKPSSLALVSLKWALEDFTKRGLMRWEGFEQTLLPDDLWAVIEPLLPAEPPKPKGEPPRVPDRAALTGVLFVLRSGTPWELLPQEMGHGSSMTCRRRLRDWQSLIALFSKLKSDLTGSVWTGSTNSS